MAANGIAEDRKGALNRRGEGELVFGVHKFWQREILPLHHGRQEGGVAGGSPAM